MAEGSPTTTCGAEANPEAVRLIQNTARVQILLIKCKGDYGYRPEGVKLGDADKILFWFRRPGSTLYRAIYGDLHAADVTADQLPQPTVVRHLGPATGRSNSPVANGIRQFGRETYQGRGGARTIAPRRHMPPYRPR